MGLTDNHPRAVVLLSGGLDSATVLAIATRGGYACHALSIRYGQRHAVELNAAQRVAASLGAVDHRVVDVDLRAIGGSALTDDAIEVPESPADGIPPTYVPARNTIMLSIALGLAEVLDARAIFAGMNAVDYSGYPDCRPAYVEQFQRLAQLATRAGVEGRGIEVQAPLLHLGKGQIIELGLSLGVDYAMTVSCYQPDADGRACRRCDACRLRRDGFEAAGVPDPTAYVSCAGGSRS
jgi:7-cyano-7-deazaguanine synthase